ncbi:MAG: fimbria/pilus periplasmic chaperone, partial [Spirochaetia bacterium]
MKRWVMLLIAVLVTGQAWGLNLEPLSMRFTPSGRDSIRTFRVTNTQEESIAVRIHMTSRELQSNGEEFRSSADSQFIVFPNRLFLAPGQTQALHVQWRGPADLEREQAYRIIVEQVAVEQERPTDEATSGGISLAFMYRYVGAVYVSPPNARPNIVLNSAKIADNDGSVVDASVLALEFENTGSGHTVLREPEVVVRGETLSGESVRYELDAERLRNLAGTNFLAGARVVQLVSLPEALNEA